MQPTQRAPNRFARAICPVVCHASVHLRLQPLPLHPYPAGLPRAPPRRFGPYRAALPPAALCPAVLYSALLHHSALLHRLVLPRAALRQFGPNRAALCRSGLHRTVHRQAVLHRFVLTRSAPRQFGPSQAALCRYGLRRTVLHRFVPLLAGPHWAASHRPSSHRPASQCAVRPGHQYRDQYLDQSFANTRHYKADQRAVADTFNVLFFTVMPSTGLFKKPPTSSAPCPYRQHAVSRIGFLLKGRTIKDYSMNVDILWRAVIGSVSLEHFLVKITLNCPRHSTHGSFPPLRRNEILLIRRVGDKTEL